MFSPKAPSTSISNSTHHHRNPAVDQVVLVLVDALRPDFALSTLSPQGGDGFSCQSPKETSLPVYASATLTYIEDALTTSVGSHTRRPVLGAFFVADAPTTTAQRLKALTTGVVPALMEAGSNFACDAVVEDNIILQLNGSCTVLGDDTWLSLFPNEKGGGEGDEHRHNTWRDARVFPSFQVDDLDTNDEGVLKVLESVLDKSWQEGTRLVLAHFLGVDHAGHTFHANHTAMHAKLAQLNVMLRRLSQYLADRAQQEPHRSTLLLVLGDHGMTDSGDHGGSSALETDSFLFAELFGASHHNTLEDTARVEHIVEGRWDRCRHNADWDDLCRLMHCSAPWRHGGASPSRPSSPLSAFRQVDLVPTLSWLLGIRIPFSNSGRVVKELMALVSGASAPPTHAQEAFLRENCQQLQAMRDELQLRVEEGELGERMMEEGVDLCQALSMDELEKYMASISRAVRRSTLHVQWAVVLMSLGVACVVVLRCIVALVRTTMAPLSNNKSTNMMFEHREAALRVALLFIVVGVVVLQFSNSFVVYEAPIVLRVVGPHTAVAIVCMMPFWWCRRRSVTPTRQVVVYLCVVLWLSSLCNPLHPTWSIQTAAFGALLRVLCDVVVLPMSCEPAAAHRGHIWCIVAVPMFLFLFAIAAFFGHGQQNTFTSIDWTASTVGGGSTDVLGSMFGLPQHLWWKGFLVMSRTFGTSLLPILALRGCEIPAKDGSVTASVQILSTCRRWYCLLWVAKALCASIAALILRSHLMVVAIFGPNVLFHTLHAAVVVLGAFFVP
ncbi:phosphodiesterase, putative [Bodo saltans]|uniref:Phosphodiesterase, putative n=1 Tax=Bodo saltans TaxID=75058 RepID=A0A0S4ITM0_BODSA|nr:phosphodiesterase, putative [Bodo saltans]|eukprot:CUF88576.1 phosphodiesterase, putative [Bodo saltans]